ncbi:LIC12162 family transferase [Thiohalocapsa halophila]|uniref:LIC12162 family transferase n=1 Tax=Thiohalocapsa halophila TaxID=69359 RepID=UPI001907B3B2|nr:LIC12162 family protein [Thiohalocapsa halophila]
MTFLQTTAIADHSLHDVLILGCWCLPEESATIHDRLPVPIRFEKSAEYYREQRDYLYYSTVRTLAGWLNEVHHVDRPEQYWELILFTFLEPYVSDFYIRSLILESAYQRISEPCVLILPESQYSVPVTASDLSKRIKTSDRFNLQIFSQIATAAGMRVRRLSNVQASSYPAAIGPRRSLLRSAYALAHRLKRGLVSDSLMSPPADRSGGNQIALLPTHFSTAALRKLLQDEGLALSTPTFDGASLPESAPDLNLRYTLARFTFDSRLQSRLVSSLVHNLPMDFVENFAHHLGAAKGCALSRPSVIVAGFFAGLQSQIWAAEKQLEGSRLVLVQHGGHYGEGFFAPREVIERRLSDKFVTWGWAEEEDENLPAPRLQPFHSAGSRGSKLLYVMRELSRLPNYRMLNGCSSEQPCGPLPEIKFFDSVAVEIRRRTVIRLRTDKRASVSIQRVWARRYPELKIDEGVRGIRYALAKARLVVVGYPCSTTFLECLTQDIPVIVFAPCLRVTVRPDALLLYEQLADVGIVQTECAEMASLVEAIWNDPVEWWKEPGRREVREQFKQRFAWAADLDDTVGWWRSFLLRESKRRMPG